MPLRQKAKPKKSIKPEIDPAINYGLIDANPENQFGTSQGVGEGAKRLLFKRTKCLQAPSVRDMFYFFNLDLEKKNPPVTLCLSPKSWLNVVSEICLGFHHIFL